MEYEALGHDSRAESVFLLHISREEHREGQSVNDMLFDCAQHETLPPLYLASSPETHSSEVGRYFYLLRLLFDRWRF